jgi:acetyl-CoA carboxylase alpha subunit
MSKITTRLEKEFNQLNEEIKKGKLESEDYKKELSLELKNLGKEKIKNTEHKIPKYSLWERLMRVLGKN